MMKSRKFDLFISIFDIVIGILGLIIFIVLFIKKGISYKIYLGSAISLLFLVIGFREIIAYRKNKGDKK